MGDKAIDGWTPRFDTHQAAAPEARGGLDTNRSPTVTERVSGLISRLHRAPTLAFELNNNAWENKVFGTATAVQVPFTSRVAAARTEPSPEPRDEEAPQAFSRRIAATLKLLSEKVEIRRRVVHAGDTVYQAGTEFDCLHVVNSGLYKIITLSPDGREQVVALKFRGDWLGLDGIARGRYGSDAVAMDTGEVWTIRYVALIEAAVVNRSLLAVLHEAMSRDITGERDSLMSVCTLPADARVADFLRYWAESLAKRGMRTDQITLRMTRAEIGNYLGLTLESVSRALSKLARAHVIEIATKCRREVEIPSVAALSAFVQRALLPAAALQ